MHAGTIRAMKAARSEGMSVRRISECFGVSIGTAHHYTCDVKISASVLKEKERLENIRRTISTRKKWQREGKILINDAGDITHKKCNGCDEMKHITEFSFDVFWKRHRNLCKPCNSKYISDV